MNKSDKHTMEFVNTDKKQYVRIELPPWYDYIEMIEIKLVNYKDTKIPFTIDVKGDNNFLTSSFNSYLDNIKKNDNHLSLKYRIMYTQSCWLHFDFIADEIFATYLRDKNNICSFGSRHCGGPIYNKMYTDTLSLYRQTNIAKNFKFLIPEKIYGKHFSSIIIVANTVIIYRLKKEIIDILKCYCTIDHYMYIDMIYLPSLYWDFLQHANIYIKIEYSNPKNAIAEIKLYGYPYLYYEGEPNTDILNVQLYLDSKPIMHGTEKLSIDNMCKFIDTHYDILSIPDELKQKNNNQYCDDIAELFCMTDLSDIFQYFNHIFNNKKTCKMIPNDVWKYIDCYMDKNFSYIYIIAEIYKKIKQNFQFDKEILLIKCNKLLYSRGLAGLRFIY